MKSHFYFRFLCITCSKVRSWTTACEEKTRCSWVLSDCLSLKTFTNKINTVEKQNAIKKQQTNSKCRVFILTWPAVPVVSTAPKHMLLSLSARVEKLSAQTAAVCLMRGAAEKWPYMDTVYQHGCCFFRRKKLIYCPTSVSQSDRPPSWNSWVC